MQDEDEEEFDFTQEQEEETGVSPQVGAMLQVAFAQQNINPNHGEQTDIIEALEEFGLPIPGEANTLLWDGLLGHDDAAWQKAYFSLLDYIEENSTHIDRNKQNEVLLNILSADRIGKTGATVQAWSELIGLKDTGEWITILNALIADLPPKTKPNLPPTQKFERRPKKKRKREEDKASVPTRDIQYKEIKIIPNPVSMPAIMQALGYDDTKILDVLGQRFKEWENILQEWSPTQFLSELRRLPLYNTLV